MTEKVISFLIHSPDGLYVEGTMGGGGHSEAILNHLSAEGQLVCLDQDEEAITFSKNRLKRYKDQVSIINENFSRINHVLDALNIDSIDGFFLDLGVSSHQLDEGNRGFSYLNNGPLDMRMSQQQQLTAEQIVNNWPEKDLANLVYDFGEERGSRQIARAIVRAREEKSRIQTTAELTEIIQSVIPFRFQNKSLSRVFQALRIAVNDEMEVLVNCLQHIYPYLKKGARVVIISYHSLEDRMVKYYFRGDPLSFKKQREWHQGNLFDFDVLTRKAVTPSDEEIMGNSRARSARLRAAEKI